MATSPASTASAPTLRPVPTIAEERKEGKIRLTKKLLSWLILLTRDHLFESFCFRQENVFHLSLGNPSKASLLGPGAPPASSIQAPESQIREKDD